MARISKIFAALHNPENNGVICAKELAKEFSVSLRTLRRDVENMGVEYSYKKDKIYFHGHYITKENDELSMAILLLKSFAYSMGGATKTQMLSLLESLESKSQENNRTDIFFTRTNLGEITLETESILLLQNAIKEHIIISFKFLQELNNTKTHTQREIMPLKILNFNGQWYLLGLESSVMKKFYLNNIADIKEVRQGESVSEEVLGRLDNALNAWFVPEAKPFMVRLWVDSKVAKYFKRKKISPNQHLDENKDGSLDITLHITSYMEIAPLVLMWIPNVVVLEPQELKDFIKKSVEKYLRVLI
ncbi:WYL domain-containing protein [Helicobacter cinaedi]|nr:WYL domain-containing protein [Helicobacter cinaedi]QOQ97115.1 WYL domain-containing protein [Helicobacter cinaedi]